MIELLRTNDPVELSSVEAVLAEAGIVPIVLDSFISSVEGSIGALPRRVMIADEDAVAARAALAALRRHVAAASDDGADDLAPDGRG